MNVAEAITRTNTIVYCRRWKETVAFYRDCLGLEIAFNVDWLVEFKLTPTSFLSIANQSLTTISSAEGKGITLSFQVEKLEAIHRAFTREGLAPTGIRSQVMGADVFYLHDPEGTRIELWTPTR
jgi:catechol 2,3-dioxygenase-like lactoylglutathione lyase family enzyme